jgi:mono/diheme cytochrome c family protein
LTDVASRMRPAEITARITNGSPNMPAYVRTLTPAQIRALTAFLASRKP